MCVCVKQCWCYAPQIFLTVSKKRLSIKLTTVNTARNINIIRNQRVLTRQRAVDAYGSALFTTYGLTMSLTFDLSTPKSHQLTFVPKCTKIVNLVKLSHAVFTILHLQTARMHKHRNGRTDRKSGKPGHRGIKASKTTHADTNGLLLTGQ